MLQLAGVQPPAFGRANPSECHFALRLRAGCLGVQVEALSGAHGNGWSTVMWTRVFQLGGAPQIAIIWYSNGTLPIKQGFIRPGRPSWKVSWEIFANGNVCLILFADLQNWGRRLTGRCLGRQRPAAYRRHFQLRDDLGTDFQMSFFTIGKTLEKRMAIAILPYGK